LPVSSSTSPRGTGESRSTEKADPVRSANDSTAEEHEPVVVYYFHRTIRCISCVRAEQWLEALLHERFASAMAEGRLVLLILNVDEEANRHFAEEFDVQSSALWITRAVPGHTDRRTLAGEIWTRVHDKAAFDAYVGGLVESYVSADGATIQKGMD